MTEKNTATLSDEMQRAFKQLCDDNSPQAFVAITVGKDLMVSFASYGVDTNGTLELLAHMQEFIKQKEQKEDEHGKTDDTTLH